MKKRLSLLLIFLFTFSLLTSCGSNEDASALNPSSADREEDSADTPNDSGQQDRNNIIIGVTDISKLDPANEFNGWGTIRYGVGETMFSLDEYLNVVPVLVTDYEISNDAMTWTFQLREDIVFHNGKPMNGDAVKACLERLVANNARAESDMMIDSINADRYSVAITTSVPNPVLINALCDPYACIVEASADDGSVDFNLYPVGTGPYVVKEYVVDESVYLEAFEGYWNGVPGLSSVMVKGVSDLDTLAFAMQNGEIDVAYGLSYDSLSLFENSSDFKVSQEATTRVYMLYFNLNSSSMSDESLRRAVSMVVDKQAYGSILLNGAGTPTKAAFPSYLPYGNDDLMVDVPDCDPEGAKALLAKSGYVDTDVDGFLEKDGEKVTLRLITYSRAGLPESAQALQSALIDIGIDVQYELVESVSTHLSSGDYDICVYAYVTTPTGDSASFLNFTTGTGNGSNFGDYTNPEVDELLELLASEFDTDKRTEYAIQIQQIITGDSAYCYMFHLNMFLVMKSGVTGIMQSPVDYYIITVDTAIAE